MRGRETRRRAKPEGQDRHRKDDRGEQKTKAGEHGRGFRLWRGAWIGPLRLEGNAVTTKPASHAADQADSRISQRFDAVRYKICGRRSRSGGRAVFLRRGGLVTA